MRDPARCRRFTIADAMLLVAATAASLAYLRRSADGYANFRDQIVPEPIAGRLHGVEWVISAFLTTWTFALLVARAWPPRPGRVRIARQPGTVACVAACLAMVSMIPYQLQSWIMSWPNFGRNFRSWNIVVVYTHSGGLLVLVAWAALASARAWRPEPGWIDRLGRLIGLLWIAYYLMGHVTQIARIMDW